MSPLLLLVVLLLSATVADGSAGGESVTFRLFDNGSSENGVDVALTAAEYAAFAADAEGDAVRDGGHPGEAFAVAMSSRIKVSKHQAPEPGER